MQAEITCLNENGTPCNETVSPEGVCSTGSAVSTLRFVLNFCTCEESSNTQAGFLDTCEDMATFPTGEAVRVTCAGSDTILIFSQNVEEGDSILLETEGGALPEETTCSVFSTIGDVLQTFTINTSGDVNLLLNDKFGSFELEACGDLNCVEEVTFTFTASNTGSVPIAVTKFEASSNGERTDFLGDLPTNDLAPGESFTVTQIQTTNICDGEYFTALDIETVAETGDVCPAEADYFFAFQPHGKSCLV